MNMRPSICNRLICKLQLLIMIGMAAPLGCWAATAPVAADAFVSQSASTVNFGAKGVLDVGDGNLVLIQLDLSSLPAGLTASNIDRAVLTVFVSKVSAPGGLDLAQVTSAWFESSVTYNTKPLSGTAMVSNVVVPASDSYVSFDITFLVKGWVAGIYPNYGGHISAALAQAGTPLQVDSKESTSTSHPAYISMSLISAGPIGPAGPAGPSGVPGANGPSGVDRKSTRLNSSHQIISYAVF